MRTHMFIGYIIERFTPPGYKRAAVICKQSGSGAARQRPPPRRTAQRSRQRCGNGTSGVRARVGCRPRAERRPGVEARGGPIGEAASRASLQVPSGGGCAPLGAAGRLQLFPAPGLRYPPRSGRAGAAANFQPVRANFGGRLCGWAPRGGGGGSGRSGAVPAGTEPGSPEPSRAEVLGRAVRGAAPRVRSGRRRSRGRIFPPLDPNAPRGTPRPLGIPVPIPRPRSAARGCALIRGVCVCVCL